MADEALLRHASLDAIVGRLADAEQRGRPFHVLHLLCHGLERRSDGKPFLVLEREAEVRAHLVPEEDLVQKLYHYVPGLQLVVFASCLTARQAREQTHG